TQPRYFSQGVCFSPFCNYTNGEGTPSPSFQINVNTKLGVRRSNARRTSFFEDVMSEPQAAREYRVSLPVHPEQHRTGAVWLEDDPRDWLMPYHPSIRAM